MKTVWGQPHGGSNPSASAKKSGVAKATPDFFGEGRGEEKEEQGKGEERWGRRRGGERRGEGGGEKGRKRKGRKRRTTTTPGEHRNIMGEEKDPRPTTS